MKNLPDFSLHGETFSPMKTFQNVYDVTACLNDLRSKLSIAINDYNLEFKVMNRKCVAYINFPEISKFELEYYQSKNKCDELAEQVRSLWSDILALSEVYERFVNKKIEKLEA